MTDCKPSGNEVNPGEGLSGFAFRLERGKKVRGRKASD
jgi:hypothetical protein